MRGTTLARRDKAWRISATVKTTVPGPQKVDKIPNSPMISQAIRPFDRA